MNIFSNFIYFLNKLEKYNISYRIEYNTSKAIMVIITVPYKKYEIEFFDDGSMEVEEFESKGVIDIDENFLEKLIEDHKD